MQPVEKHVYFAGKGNSKLTNKKLHWKKLCNVRIIFIRSDQKFGNKCCKRSISARDFSQLCHVQMFFTLLESNDKWGSCQFAFGKMAKSSPFKAGNLVDAFYLLFSENLWIKPWRSWVIASEEHSLWAENSYKYIIYLIAFARLCVWNWKNVQYPIM